MAIAAIDWALFSTFILFVIFLVMDEETALFDILGAVMALVFAAVLDANVLNTVDTFVRIGVLLSLFIVAIILMVRGTLRLPSEFGRGS